MYERVESIERRESRRKDSVRVFHVKHTREGKARMRMENVILTFLIRITYDKKRCEKVRSIV